MNGNNPPGNATWLHASLSSRFSETFFKEISFGGTSPSDRNVASPKAFPRIARLGGEDVHVFVAGTCGRRAAKFRPSETARRGNEDRNVFAPKKPAEIFGTRLK